MELMASKIGFHC